MGLGLRLELRQEIRMPKFRDIPLFRRLKADSKPSKVVLISPHANEHPVAMPFQKALADKLESKGIQTEQRQIDGMMERGWSLRKKIAQGNFENYYSSSVDRCCDFALGIEDYLQRFRLISDILAKFDDKGLKYVLEMHAMENFGLDDTVSSKLVSDFRRVAPTPILITYFLSDFSPWFKEICDEAFSNEYHEITRKIAKERGFDFDGAVKELEGRLRGLKRFAKNILAFEIPSRGARLPEDHPMFDLYFEKRDDGFIQLSVSGFESAYCPYLREPLGLEESHVDAVAKIFLFPKIRT